MMGSIMKASKGIDDEDRIDYDGVDVIDYDGKNTD